MSVDLPLQVVTWHEDDLADMTMAPRPGAVSRARPFIGEERGIAFRVSSTRMAGDRKTDFYTPRHRHTFDQVRFYFGGVAKYGTKETYRAGDCLYIPGGTFYGPLSYENTPEDLRLFDLQYVGMSGRPYLGPEQVWHTHELIKTKGHFEKGTFIWKDGKRQDAFEVLVQEHLGHPVEYPVPGLNKYAAVRSAHLPWRNNSALPGIEGKFLGHFTDVGPNVSMMRMAAGVRTPGGQKPYQQLRCLIEGSVRFVDDGERVFTPASLQYVPAQAPYGEIECVDEATLVLVKWAEDGQLYLPDPLA